MSQSEVSLKRFYFALFDDGIDLQTLNWRLSVFEFKLFIYNTHRYEMQVLVRYVLASIFSVNCK